MSLPTPIGRQKEVLVLPAKGHFAILGTAGSGKTTLAILRAAYLSDPDTDHNGRTLLVTFNRTLVTYLHHLRENRLRNVTVETYHKFARGYLNSLGLMGFNAICSYGDDRKKLIEKAVRQVAAGYNKNEFFERSVDFFSEEIKWISQNGIQSADVYGSIKRVGRFGSRVSKVMRPVMYEIYEAYKALLQDSGKKYDWDSIATAVADKLSKDVFERRYKHVVIDEGQDFSPEMIRSLVNLLPPDGSLTFFGDVAQQIYGNRISWRSAGLKISKVWTFEENYRNSRQIAQLGLAISKMPYFIDDPDMVEPKAPTADGPLPTLVECGSREAEIKLILSEAVKASRTRTVAILFRNREDEKLISSILPRGCIKLHSKMKTWAAEPGIRYGTYHSAKGLEFDMIILPFCSTERLPDPDSIDAFGEEEAMMQEGRLLYVGVTRARTWLVITYSGELTKLLPRKGSLYQVVEG